MSVSNTFNDKLADTYGGPGYTVISVNGTYHPGVEIKWIDGAKSAPEVTFTEGAGSRQASASLLINPEGFLDLNTTILGETGDEADCLSLSDKSYVDIGPGAEGYIGLEGEVTKVDGVKVVRCQHAFKWDAKYEGTDILCIPSLACWASQAKDSQASQAIEGLDLDEQ